MKYESASCFRMALEERLRTESLATGVALSRLRKTVAFDRLLARLLEQEPDAWVLKGGLALQLRLQDRARTTRDIDLHTRERAETALNLLVSVALLDLGDHFRFEVARPSTVDAPLRCAVRSVLAGRVFESFHVDLGCEEERIGAVSHLLVSSLLEFAGIPPVEFPCFPLGQHLAEKVHALVRPRGGRDNSRVKDLVDIVLIAETASVDPLELRAALIATFEADLSCEMPLHLPEPRRAWESQYRALAKDLGLQASTLEEGAVVARALIDPALRHAVS
ncbi:nucleotidyl transferase AbiEii/AbiGii toxin family protein [Anaerosoma tenue]|uniref:nucleotidyl transferase AbiEii/AbiGii toxin family protein n=1 Tax=Anaerosoma tenue TaxID=2933588 RepID=UPI002260ED60|nr:nucleotidyl transferase AbiEii/AbiGii toxin family protein [Anaerosoma tenue]MCK8114782.1 nucleotidyl transferase AbiEii/AbiGii toxin family protein [Anaerosoma tenue]